MSEIDSESLDRFITGNYGEDSFSKILNSENDAI